MLSTSNSNVPLEPTRGQVLIDQEIAPLQSAIRGLRTRRNARALISKFPSEVLSEIFLFAKPMSIAARSHQIYPRGRGWLNVAGVCRSWRDIALDTARLWNEIDTTEVRTLRWGSIMLARSKATPLFVKHPKLQREQAMLDAIFASFARIQELDIDAEYDTLQRLFSSCGAGALAHPTAMQALRLCNTSPEDSDTMLMISQVFKIPMPSLQTLVLLNVDLPSTIPLLPQLRRFVIQTQSPSMSSRLLLSTLRRTPNLEELEYEHRPSKPPTRGMKKYPTVELPRLTLLSLKTSSYDISGVFKSIHYSPSSRVLFSATEVPDPRILADVLSHFAGGGLAAEVDEVLVSDSPSQFNLKASVDGVPSFHINCHSSDLVRVDLLRLATMIPSSNVETLLLRGYNLVKRAEWMKLFNHFDHVVEVKLLEEREDFIRILMKLRSDERVPLPNLEVLTLEATLIDRSFSRAVESLVAQRRALNTPAGVFKLKGYRCMVYLRSSESIEHEVSFVWDSADLTLEEVLDVHDDEDKDFEYSQDQYNEYDHYDDHDYEYYF